MSGGMEDRDVQKLAELGYRQELTRAWSGFTNFAISFTIISVLAGVFTNFRPRIAAVTLEEVAGAARSILSESNRTVGWFDPLPVD